MEQDNFQERYNNVAGEIICRFETRMPAKFHVDSSKMTLSTDFDQEGVNTLIRNLLADKFEEQMLDKLQFQFIIGGELLRGKIRSHLVRYSISSESVLTIQYFLALGSPEESHELPEDDWVSCLTSIFGSQENCYAASLYNGEASIYVDHKLAVRSKISNDPIKCLRSVPCQVEDQHYLIAGGLSERLVIAKLYEKELTVVADGQSSGNCINSIDISPLLDGMLCSVAGRMLTIWKIPSDLEAQPQVKKKKMKKQHLSTVIVRPEASQELHESDILCAVWASSNEIYTSSLDHTIQLIDVEKLQSSLNITTGDSVATSIDVHEDTIISSHEDGCVRLWDRKNPTKAIKKFKSHLKYASNVKFSSSPYIFCSASYDHTVKLWDTRSIFPLETIATHHDKVLTTLWQGKNEIISGGTDSNIMVHRIS